MINEEWWMLKDEWWKMMISSCWGVSVTDRQMNKQTNEHTDICECRVAFATENLLWINVDDISKLTCDHDLYVLRNLHVSWNLYK